MSCLARSSEMHHKLALKDPLDKVDAIWDGEAIAFSDKFRLVG